MAPEITKEKRPRVTWLKTRELLRGVHLRPILRRGDSETILDCGIMDSLIYVCLPRGGRCTIPALQDVIEQSFSLDVRGDYGVMYGHLGNEVALVDGLSEDFAWALHVLVVEGDIWASLRDGTGTIQNCPRSLRKHGLQVVRPGFAKSRHAKKPE